MDQLTVMQEVVAELAKRDIKAYLEYPGFIQVSENDGPNSLNFGTANEFWGFDVSDFDGQSVDIGDCTESNIPSDSTDVMGIVEYIIYCVIEWNSQPRS